MKQYKSPYQIISRLGDEFLNNNVVGVQNFSGATEIISAVLEAPEERNGKRVRLRSENGLESKDNALLQVLEFRIVELFFLKM